MNCANHPDRERSAFCQNCGKPLCQECTRTVGSAVFCEPCLVAKLAGAGAPNPAGGPTPGVNYPVDGTVLPPPPPDEPNPSLAALLGFIPGVGAMYNGQYAKGIVHLIVFAILVSLAGENGIFGLFIAGWVFYQVIEAHHTAQARRDGTPLPNPFGLNDLGERLGFGKSWPSGTHGRSYGQGTTPAPDATVPPPASYSPPPSGYQPYPPPPATNWGASWENYVPPVPPASPYTGPIPPADFTPPPTGNRFPMGAVWLIALGVIFLISNSGMMHGYATHLFVPLLLIGFGVWQIVHKMTDSGGTLVDDGTASYRFRLFHALRSGIWIMLIGVLFLLDSTHILSWGRSWPLFIIVAGVLAILQRAAFSSPPIPAYPYTPYPSAGPVPPTASTPIVPSVVPSEEPYNGASETPSNRHDEEGR